MIHEIEKEKQSRIDNVYDTMTDEEEAIYRALLQKKQEVVTKSKPLLHKAKLWGIWLVLDIAMIPVIGSAYAAIWNWFVSLVGLNSINWMQAYCLVFAARVLFTGFKESDESKEIRSIIDGTCTKYDAWDLPDSLLVAILILIYTLIPLGVYFFTAWVLSCFLYM